MTSRERLSPGWATGAGVIGHVLPPDEAELAAAYDPDEYPRVAVAVDIVALTIREASGGRMGGQRDDEPGQRALHVLLVQRGEWPFAGYWALPGGFVRPHEDLDQAAARELAEETGLVSADDPQVDAGRQLEQARVYLEQLRSYGAPDRDPRMRTFSVAYLAFAPNLPDPSAGGDAAEAAWVPVAEVDSKALAFDHEQILADGLERARSKLEYTTLATSFVDDEFTISELLAVYEAVWGQSLHAPNFHRKVLSTPGFVEDTGTTTSRGGARGGRRARLYRAGPATHLHPALLRPAGDPAADQS
ncbi:MAG: NUDIX hydrolase [Frankia sp.]|nr:NUDIX hydrolase [Frankia sp.]